MKLSLTEVECESLAATVKKKKKKKNTSKLHKKCSCDGKKMLACQTETMTASVMLTNMLKKFLFSIRVYYLSL